VQMWQKRRLSQRLTIFGELKDLIKTRGIPGLYQHLPLTLVRDCLGLGLFFVTFETARKLTVSEHPHTRIQNSLAVILSGALAGLAHQVVYHPTDLLKRMLIIELGHQNRPNPPVSQMWALFQELIVRKHGLRFLFLGYANSLSKVFSPSSLSVAPLLSSLLSLSLVLFFSLSSVLFGKLTVCLLTPLIQAMPPAALAFLVYEWTGKEIEKLAHKS